MIYEMGEYISNCIDSLHDNAKLAVGAASADIMPFTIAGSLKLCESGQYGMASALFIANIALGANAGYMLSDYYYNSELAQKNGD